MAALLSTFAPTPVAHADIFEWEYINSSNPAQGKQPSTKLTTDGAGVSAVPGANLTNRYLTMAYLVGADLTNASVSFSNLTNAELSQANLTSANFSGFVDYGEFGGFYPGADLTNANLSQANLSRAKFAYATLTGASLVNAQVRGADLTSALGFTPTQLYSTASYLAHDLTGIVLSGNDLTGVNLANQNLTNANFSKDFDASTNLNDADLSQANLTNVNFGYAALTNATLTGADVRGATFTRFYDSQSNTLTRGITLAQLYSTASYLAHDLTEIGLAGHNLAGVNLAGQNLTDSYFGGATLSGANLAGAEVRGATFAKYSDGTEITLAQLYSMASYQASDLSRISLIRHDLTGANFAGQNLTSANFRDAMLTGVDLTGTEVRGADFGFIYGSSGMTAAQLYSTASYQAHDLSGIVLMRMNLAAADLAAQNFTNANFQYATLNNANLSHSNLTGAKFSQSSYDYYGDIGYSAPSAHLAGANLSHANLTNADFSGWEFNGDVLAIFFGANLTGANLYGADARGARFEYAKLTGANTSNLIQTDGHISGLNLTAGASLVVRDYDGNPTAYLTPTGPLPIVVEQHMAMDATGTLRLVFDADPWDSTISFAPGIPVARGGTLELTFASDVNPVSQIGRTLDLFNWTGVAPTGAFTVSSPYTWNLSNLYTTGEVTLATVPSLTGDFNHDGTVDAADYVVWRMSDGTQAGYNSWRTHFGEAAGAGTGEAGASPFQGAVPETSSALLLILGAALGTLKGHRITFRVQLARKVSQTRR